MFPHVDRSNLIQQLSDSARESDLDIQTLLEEQLKDPYHKLFANGSEALIQDLRKQPKLTNQKPPNHTTTSFKNFLSKMTPTSCVIENQYRVHAEPR